MATQPETGQPKKGGVVVLVAALLALIGPATTQLVLTEIPMEESGRKVAVTVSPQAGTATITNISGKQYLRVYLDMIGVATACDGLTGEGIMVGREFTEGQCAQMLVDRLTADGARVMACTPGLALSIPRRDHVRYAALSLGHHVGWPTYCASTMRRQINAGQIRAACTSLTWFNKAGGRVVPGIVARRKREQAICLKDAT
ncbi:glycoside hydrolase family protein [Novosphingobium sediminicola]|uniref:Lysozyme n=1 Tax=Novosphingobium sediminicola TaxID=563162 RepID=A0A7W6CLG5_9SPHN|nr:glycoside hydrolase family protein [Novosphingobium sediminicola]MBB3955925.1 lysozyme [Novosphingobium sediminicola]